MWNPYMAFRFGNKAENSVEFPALNSVHYDMQQQFVDDTVLVRIEPFFTVVTEDVDSSESLFPGQIFLLRHVQVEQEHFLQGFRLNEQKLLEETDQSVTYSSQSKCWLLRCCRLLTPSHAQCPRYQPMGRRC